jgi:hypothetical protein
MIIIEPHHYNADGLDCKTWWLADEDDAYPVSFENPLVQKHLDKIKANLKEHYIQTNPKENDGVLEIQWD